MTVATGQPTSARDPSWNATGNPGRPGTALAALLLVTLALGGCVDGGPNASGGWDVRFDPELDVSACKGSVTGLSTQAIRPDLNGIVSTTWPANQPDTVQIAMQLNGTSFFANLKCLTTGTNGVMSGSFQNGFYTGHYTFGGKSGNVTLTRSNDGDCNGNNCGNQGCNNGDCGNDCRDQNCNNNCNGQNCNNDCQGQNCGNDNGCGPNGCPQDCRPNEPNCHGNGPQWSPAGLWNVEFTPPIDVSSCTSRHLTWNSQILNVPQSGAFSNTWSPNEPGILEATGGLHENNFDVNLRCTNPPSNGGNPTGHMNGGRNGDGFSGGYSFFDGPSGTVRLSRTGGPTQTTSPSQTTTPPASFTLVAPASGSSGVSLPATFRWTALSGAQEYMLQISSNSAFTSIQVSRSGITATSYEVQGGLTSGTLYYWRVVATTPTGHRQASNDPFTFTLGTSSSPTSPTTSPPPTSTTSPPTSSSTWKTLAPMPQARSGAQGAALNGKFYVTGGSTDDASMNQLVVYDPATNAWTSLGSSPYPYVTQGAAAGAAGIFYVMGGCADQPNTGPDCQTGTINALRAFDPATSTWSTKAPMPTPRLGIVAAVINDKIYVAGGTGACPPCDAYTTLEVYDPAADAWTTKAPMSKGRTNAYAGVVNGRLYVAGGSNGPNICDGRNCTMQQTAEAYDPVTNTWSNLPSMPESQTAGGSTGAGGKFFAISGIDPAGSRVAVTRIYDPSTNAWTVDATSLTKPRQLPVTATIGNTIYVTGGADAGNQFLSSLEALTLPSSWVARAALPAAREGPAVAAIGDALYVAGGNNAGGVTTLYKYDVASNAWTTKASVPGVRWGAEAAAVDGKLYMAGGWGEGCCPSSNLYRYDPAADAWTSLAAAPSLTACGSAAVISNKIYITTPCNGYSGVRPFLQVYDPAANTWAQLPDSPVAHMSGAIAAIDGKLYAAGGFDADNSWTSRVDVFDPATNSWTQKASMPAPRAGMAGFGLNGRLYAVGGNSPGGAVDGNVLVYDPSTNSWSNGPSLAGPRSDARGAVLGGTIYVVGGNSGAGALASVEAFTP